MKKPIYYILCFCSLILFCQAAFGYYFKGYYVPICLISPMKDDQVYTPVGLGVITSKAGFRTHPLTGKGDFHSGVDLAANLNDRVYNLLDGIVVNVGWRNNLGVALEIYHPYPNIRTICGHLNAFSVKPGMWVRRGQVIGYAGSTGRSTGVHLHYTVIRHDTNQYIEPVAYLLQVPKYIRALKIARNKATLAHNTAEFQRKQSSLSKIAKVSDSSFKLPTELPEKTEETAPPDPDDIEASEPSNTGKDAESQENGS